MDDLTRLYGQFDPTHALEADDNGLYVDWQKDLGPDNLKELLARGIERSGSVPVTRLFTGHRGVGKTTELKRVGKLLETGPKKYFVSMLEAEQWMDLEDVTPTDIVYQIVRQLVTDLDRAGFSFARERFGSFFQEIWEQLGRPVDIQNLKMKPGAGFEIGVALKEVPLVRAELRQLLQARLPRIYDLINDVILGSARPWLQQARGFDDIVVIVDELDRIRQKVIHPGLTNQENIFLDHSGILRFLNCDVIYTVPIELAYSRCRERLRSAFSAEIHALPVIPVTARDGSAVGLETLTTIVRRRTEAAGVKLERLFESPGLVERLCRVSGGHVRSLFLLLRSVFDRSDTLPLTEAVVERTIKQQASSLLLPISSQEQAALRKVHETKQPPENAGDTWYGWLRDLFVLAYRDDSGEWYDWNPLLGEVNK